MVVEINYDVAALMSAPDINSEMARQAGQQMMASQQYLETEEKQEVKVTIDGHEFRVNPQQMNWSKEFKIEEAEVVYEQDITQWMGPKNRRLGISLKTFTEDEKDFLWYLGDEDGVHNGPHLIEAAIPTGSICMYLKKGSGQQVEGESDNMWYWTLEFWEANENGI
jgi:hypothetical protein